MHKLPLPPAKVSVKVLSPPPVPPGLPLPPAKVSAKVLPLPPAKVSAKVLPLPPVSPRLPPSILALPVPLPVPVVSEEDPEENIGWNLYYSPEAPTIFSYYVSKKRKDPSHIPMAFNIDIPEGAPNLYVYGIIEKKPRKLVSGFFYTIKEAKDYLEYNEYGKGYRVEKFSKKIFFPVYRI